MPSAFITLRLSDIVDEHSTRGFGHCLTSSWEPRDRESEPNV
jgi:hypothetical protein